MGKEGDRHPESFSEATTNLAVGISHLVRAMAEFEQREIPSTGNTFDLARTLLNGHANGQFSENNQQLQFSLDAVKMVHSWLGEKLQCAMERLDATQE